MIVLGIDPGTRRVGYGAVEKRGGKMLLREAGILKIKSEAGAGALFELKTSLRAAIRRIRPEAAAIEKIYFAKNQKTAMAVAEARGVALLTCRELGLKIFEYSPNEVKAGVAGHGLADKKAVLKMVKLTLGEPKLKVMDDASDALALAIMGCSGRGGLTS